MNAEVDALVALRALLLDERTMPRRIEYISGQSFAYVKLDDVIGHIEALAARPAAPLVCTKNSDCPVLTAEDLILAESYVRSFDDPVVQRLIGGLLAERAALASPAPQPAKKRAADPCEAHGVPACVVCLTDEVAAPAPVEPPPAKGKE